MPIWPKKGGVYRTRALIVAIGLAAGTFAPPSAVAGPLLPTLEPLTPQSTVTLNGDVFHVQGVDVDADFIYVTSVDKHRHRGFLHKFTHDGALVKTIDLSEGVRFHPGGISLDGNALWIPLAEYRSNSSTRVIELDKTTLEPITSFMVKDHIGAITMNAGRLYGANWNAKRIYVWDSTGHRLFRHRNRLRVNYQDLKSADGDVVASGTLNKARGMLDWLDPQTLLPHARLTLGMSTAGVLWSQEGMAIDDRRLYLLPADGQDGHTTLYVFDLATLKAQATDVPAVTTP